MKMLSIRSLLVGKYHWERGELALALQRLNEVLARDEANRAFYLTSTEVEDYARLSFENAITSILLDDSQRMLPFDEAFAQLWSALPAQYLILVLAQRALDRALETRLKNIFSEAASQGLLSHRVEDYDLSGKVVLTQDAFPELVGLLGSEEFLATVRRAVEEDAWSRFIAAKPELVFNLFLYAVFHRERPIHREMILIRLERIAEDHAPFLSAVARALRDCFDNKLNHEEIVSVGLRIEGAQNPSSCLQDFYIALSARKFETFVERYYPSEEYS